ncbi:secreted RxLR effector protein 161-like [Quercus lobata]|uniref:secreted RxLR effector protein 161-like n=1 Tax=Quercus lobata TaxID=97700 RepID=UPI00124919D1|nr:secreted RxLR effector protein 161-like [Quercus lobata]
MIGSLLYLTASRPDVSYSVGVFARYQANPKESHMIALKRIIKYVKTTADFGVWYNKDTNDILARYSDADWAENADNRKSTSGGCFYVGNNLVSWMSKKQNSISLSTAEAEYIVASSCCTQLLWMQKLLHDYSICQKHLTIYYDNTNAINISKNQKADLFTKPFDRKRFEFLYQNIGDHRVDRITRRQAVMGGYTMASFPEASEDDSDGYSSVDDTEDDDDGSPSDDEMST